MLLEIYSIGFVMTFVVTLQVFIRDREAMSTPMMFRLSCQMLILASLLWTIALPCIVLSYYRRFVSNRSSNIRNSALDEAPNPVTVVVPVVASMSTRSRQ